MTFRKDVLNKLTKLGLIIDEEKNKKISRFSDANEGEITKEESKIACHVIPTDEELMIAIDTYEYINN